MNPSLLFGKAAGPNAAPAAPPQFPANQQRGAAAAPFSSLLERATPRPPARPEASAKSAGARRDRATAPGDAEVRSERRESGRTKKPREREDAQALAEVVAANPPPMKIEVPEQLAAAATAGPSTEAGSGMATASGGAGVNAAPNAAAGANSTPLAALQNTVGPAPATTALAAGRSEVVSGASPAPTASIPPMPAGTGEALAGAIDVSVFTAEAGEGISVPLANPAGLSAESLSAAGLATAVTPAGAAAGLEASTPVVAARMEAMPAALVRRELDAALVVASAAEDVSQASSARQLAATTLAQPAVTEPAAGGADVSDAASASGAAEAVAVATPVTAEEARRAARAERRSWQETVENTRGMGVAKHSQTMKNTMKQEDFAGPPLQILPGGVLSGKILPGDSRATGMGEIGSVEALNAAAKMPPAPTRADQASGGDLLEVRAASPMARIGEVISREVRMFKRGGDDLVEVVLTPDAKTQISLRLQWREGTVEVQARCDHGDHQSLTGQWAQLQTSLAQHGVRLSHLSERAPTGFTEFFNNPSFSQQQGGERRATPHEVTEPLAAAGPLPTKSGPAKSGARGNRLFDSWA